MKINWKVRFKNPVFISQLVLAIFIPILGYMGITAQDLTTWGIVWDMLAEAVSNPYVLILVIVSVYNALTDPTTNGFGDSIQAMRYNKPKKEVK